MSSTAFIRCLGFALSASFLLYSPATADEKPARDLLIGDWSLVYGRDADGQVWDQNEMSYHLKLRDKGAAHWHIVGPDKTVEELDDEYAVTDDKTIVFQHIGFEPPRYHYHVSDKWLMCYRGDEVLLFHRHRKQDTHTKAVDHEESGRSSTQFVVAPSKPDAADKKTADIDLTGEWAIDWEDPKEDYKETFFINITHDGDDIDGTGLDPDMIPTTIKGTVTGGRIEIECAPSRHPLPFRQAVRSTFEGTVTDRNSMQGTWQFEIEGRLFSRRKGPWTARRLAENDPRPTVTMSTKLPFSLSSEEYDVWHYRDDEDPEELKKNKAYQAEKEARKVGDHYELPTIVLNLRDTHRSMADLNRINKRSLVLLSVAKLLGKSSVADDEKRDRIAEEIEKRRRLQARLQTFLNQNGYPWNLDRDSQTVKFPQRGKQKQEAQKQQEHSEPEQGDTETSGAKIPDTERTGSQ